MLPIGIINENMQVEGSTDHCDGRFNHVPDYAYYRYPSTEVANIRDNI